MEQYIHTLVQGRACGVENRL